MPFEFQPAKNLDWPSAFNVFPLGSGLANLDFQPSRDQLSRFIGCDWHPDLEPLSKNYALFSIDEKLWGEDFF